VEEPVSVCAKRNVSPGWPTIVGPSLSTGVLMEILKS